MSASILTLLLFANIPIWGATPISLGVEFGPSLLLGDNIKNASLGPSVSTTLYFQRFPGFEQGLGMSFIQGKCSEDTLYRYLDLYVSADWEMDFGNIHPFLMGLVGASRWWVLKGGKVVTFMWGDRYQATSLLLGGGMGVRIPVKSGAVELLLKGRFLFSQNQQRFGIEDANEGTIGLSFAYRIKL